MGALWRKYFPLQVTKKFYLWMAVLVFVLNIILGVFSFSKMGDVHREEWLWGGKVLLAGLLMLMAGIILLWIIFSKFKRELSSFVLAIAEDRPIPTPEVLSELVPLVEVIKKRTEELSREVAISTSLAEVSRKLLSMATFNEISLVILDHLRSLTGSKYGYAAYIDPVTGYLVVPTHSKENCNLEEKEFVFKEFRGLWGWVLQHRQPLLTNHPAEDLRSQGVPQGHIPIQRFLSVPAMINGTLVGQVALANSERDYTNRDLELVKRFTDLYAIAIHRQQTEERFFKAFNTNPCVMAISTVSDGRYIDVNENFANLLGYNRSEVIGRSAMEVGIWADPKEREKLVGILLEQGTLRSKEIHFRAKSGKFLVGLVSAEIITIGGEKCLLFVASDITERKYMENEMARLDRLNIVGEMAAGIAHEIRNPLTTIRGFLQILGGKKYSAQYKEYYDLMIEELDRANSIIREYLSLARNSAQDFVLSNLNDIIHALYPLMQADAMNAYKNIKLELNDIPKIPLDEKQIRQLILNLVRNGLEAMSEEGVLIIKTLLDGEEVVLSVRDQGEGIEPAVLEKLGTPFFTTKENGTGLGLSTCYSIATRHHASIKIETGSGGTTFFIRFRVPVR